ncbi:MAG TPA: hypothetical protein VH482_10395 [Thermomicrobiales bacterium]
MTRLVELAVDPWGDRCGDSFWLRADLADGLRAVLVTSHGGAATGGAAEPGAEWGEPA